MIDHILEGVNQFESSLAALLFRLRVVYLVEPQHPIWAVNEEFGVVVIDRDWIDIGAWLHVSLFKNVLLFANFHLIANWFDKVKYLLIVFNQQKIPLFIFRVK